jgi:hypothetical protein
VTTTRRLERLAAQVEVKRYFIQVFPAPKEAARVAVINPHLCKIERKNMKKMWVVKDSREIAIRTLCVLGANEKFCEGNNANQ